MNTEFAFDKQRKVVFPLLFKFVTARTIAGCYMKVDGDSDCKEVRVLTKGMIFRARSMSSLLIPFS